MSFRRAALLASDPVPALCDGRGQAEALRRRQDTAQRLAPLADGRRDPDDDPAAGAGPSVAYCCASMTMQERQFIADADEVCPCAREMAQ
jgi:hypothetical protein